MPYQKFPVGQMLERRRFKKVLYPLSDAKKKLLLEAPVNEVFHKEFVTQFPELVEGLKSNGLHTPLMNIRRACRNKRIANVEQLLELSYQHLISADGMGPKAMAFLLDFATAFGFKIEGAPDAVPNKEKPRTGAELAQLLKKK